MYVVCKVRMRITPTECLRCLYYGHMSRICQGIDRRREPKTCNEKDNRIFCRDRGVRLMKVSHVLRVRKGEGEMSSF